MANVPFPLTGTDLDELKLQLYEMLRRLYEEKIGGADLGDVFSLPGDVLTLALDTDAPGLQKTDNKLSVKAASTGGLSVAGSGVGIKILSTGGMEVGATGLAIKLADASLTCDADGLKVTDFNITSGMATMASGTVTVTDASVTANSRIFASAQFPCGGIFYITKTAGVGFDITSTDAGDAGSVAWMKIEP